MGRRCLFVVSARLDGAAREAVASGAWPRKDFLALAGALDADVIDYATVERRRSWRLLRRVAGMPAAQAWIAFRARGRYDRIFTDGEHIGIPLALLLRLARRRPRHVTLGHKITTANKRRVWRWLRPQRGIDALLLHATSQVRAARDELGFAEHQAELVAYQVDTEFWQPVDVATEDMICTVGLEYRDYPTFIEAVRGLPVRVVIAASSRWSVHGAGVGDAPLPDNVEVTSLDYVPLRDLYARSRFVVMPLRETDNQAGITTILEGMAMGKAVIVSATTGQRDVIHGRLCRSGGPTDERLGSPAPFGVPALLAQEETGLYVSVGDAAALRAAIQHLLDHPEEAARMGAAGRRVVAGYMNLERFVERVAAIAIGEPSVSHATSMGSPLAALGPQGGPPPFGGFAPETPRGAGPRTSGVGDVGARPVMTPDVRGPAPERECAELGTRSAELGADAETTLIGQGTRASSVAPVLSTSLESTT